MAHSEKRGHWLKEGAIALGTGTLFGVTSVAVGQPFDTLKTKMQAQAGFAGKSGGGVVQALTTVLRQEGVAGLYRGWFPPMWGSGIYRSTQFAVFEALYTKWDDEAGRTEIPGTHGLQLRVVQAGAAASLARSIIECPIEYSKVAGQTGQAWHWRSMYKGFGLQLGRTSGVMVTYFCIIDSVRRHHPEVFGSRLGQFVASAGAATAGFWLVWPLEVLKNQVQAGFAVGDKGVNAGPIDRLRYMVSTHGVSGLFRGIVPGTLRSIVSNGSAMVVMVKAQQMVTAMGWRD